MADQQDNVPAPDPEEGKGNEEKKDDEQQLLPADPDNPPKEEKKKDGPLNTMNYAFLDGLRGFGALTVYLQHFMYEAYDYFLFGRPDPGTKAEEKYHEPPAWLKFVQGTPFHIFTNGSFWVCLFFILSGFVLTLRYMKVRNESSIYGGTFRRYIRLALPLFFIMQIYYLVAKTDMTTQDETLLTIKKKKGYHMFLLDNIFGVWFGNNDYAYVTWTLTTELWATFYVFLLAQTVVHYKHRYILYIVVQLFLYIPRIAEDQKFVEYGFSTSNNNSKLDTNIRQYLPYFTYGVIFADVEMLRESVPLDRIRELGWGAKIPINLVLGFLAVSYGSMTMVATCEVRDESDCAYQDIVTFGVAKDAYWFFQTIGTLALFLLALTSPVLQWVLASWPFWFLGKVSYTLYLFHLLIVKWPCTEMQKWFYANDTDYDLAVLYTFLIWTPVLLVLSWVLEFGIDTPSKEFAHALDQISRFEEFQNKKKPDPNAEKKEGEDEEEDSGCSKFLSEQWILWVHVGFTFVVGTVCTIYGSIDGNGERIMNTGGDSADKAASF